MTGWRIRQAGPEDAAAVLVANVFDGPAKAEAVSDFPPPHAPDPRNILLLAELEGGAVGFASATVVDHPVKARALFLQERGVNEETRRRGIARALIAAVREEGRRRVCGVTWVLTEPENGPERAT